jgi:hypothetical protein
VQIILSSTVHGGLIIISIMPATIIFYCIL